MAPLQTATKFIFRYFKTFLLAINIAIDKTLYKEKISGRQNAAILADFLPELPKAEAEAFSDRKEATFRQLAKGQLTPLPGLLALLEQVKKQGLATAVVTNAPPKTPPSCSKN